MNSLSFWLNDHQALTIIVLNFIFVGLFLQFIELKADENNKVKSKWEAWLTWSISISAFLISGFFALVAVIATTIKLFTNRRDRWYIALALVAVVKVVFYS